MKKDIGGKEGWREGTEGDRGEKESVMYNRLTEVKYVCSCECFVFYESQLTSDQITLRWKQFAVYCMCK